MRASDEDPSGPSAKFAQRGCIGNQHFLLPVARGSATVAVPLSLDTQAAPREEGRGRGEGDGGWPSRRDKGRGLKRRCVAVSTSYFVCLISFF